MSEMLKIRPYARLLSMLGEQLIKNERIALIELIKNSYDADASWVKVTFSGFGENYEVRPESKIIIQDDGNGMTRETLSTSFLNPATPGKKRQKGKNDKTLKGRIIQGEKGIGRFAMLKLGRKIDVVSKTQDDKFEHVLHYDFSKYDAEFLKENNEEKELYLDNLDVLLEERIPDVFKEKDIIIGVEKRIQPTKGTLIEISHLNEGWTNEKVEFVAKDVMKLQSIFDTIINKSSDTSDVNSFLVYLYKDNKWKNEIKNYTEELLSLIENKPALRIDDGRFDSEKMVFSFKLNGIFQQVSLNDSVMRGIKKTKDYFKPILDLDLLNRRQIECGSFSFKFYFFDFNANPSAKYYLANEEKEILRQHKIYLYRDNVRVYPYGDPDDDWLEIDVLRGTYSAGALFSNDQVVGVVKISHSENPKLKDKTNREGLIEDGYATLDFIRLLQTFLIYIRKGPYAKYLIDNKQKNNLRQISEKKLTSNFDELRNIVKDNKKAVQKIDEIETAYKSEKQFLTKRAETSESLAGVGLSVETASHDIMKMMSLAVSNLDSLINNVISSSASIDRDSLIKELNSIRGSLGFVQARLKDIQLLFTSSKQRRRNIRVKEIVEKVVRIYQNMAQKANVKITINELHGSPLMAKTTDAVLLQLLLNLFDNSIYWLDTVDQKNKEILVTLDGEKCKLIFSDNGPGIAESDLPYIFEAFYSGKGEEGRGLGLYIARQLLERNDYSIDYAELKSDKRLSGANFVINFVSEEK